MSVLLDVNLPCCVCGGEASGVFARPDVSRWGQTAEFVLRRCEGCGLVFNSPRLTDDELAGLYRSNYYVFDRPADAECARIVGCYRRTLAHLPHGTEGPVLEVGSAKGYMLALLAELGWEATGVELSEYAAAVARRSFGVEVFAGTLARFREEDGRRFGVVLAQDVLEHVPDPPAFLAGLAESLLPGGWLVVDTPNLGYRHVPALGDRWRGFNPFHIYLFDQHTLRRSLERAGLVVRAMGSYNDLTLEESLPGPPPTRPRFPRVTAVSRAVKDRLARRYLARAVQAVRASGPIAFDPACQGENLVCLASRSA
jgi:2-polyprenyl-3-methyl-5-hydroxy-6-metoxy-1,4-benzoquinol methylase